MSNEILNLKVLSKSRKKTKPGDIFVLKPKGHDYYYGRTIRIDAECGFGPPKAVLIYIYNATSTNKNEIPTLDKNNLLLSPVLINHLPWSKGYFETIFNKPLADDDLLRIHCFKDPVSKRYVDEYGKTLDKAYEPIGEYGLASYRVVDDEISEKLGIPLAPD